jgi:hypothetical protein
VYGGIWNATTGLVTSNFNSGDVYTAAGSNTAPLNAANNSESFVNFSGTGGGAQNGASEAALLGIPNAPSSYALYVYRINQSLSCISGSKQCTATGFLEVDWSTALPLGTYVAAFGIDSKNSNQVYDSAFSVSGWANTPGGGGGGGTPAVPEPASVILLGTVAVGICAVIKKKARA